MKIVFMGSADFGIPALERLMQDHTITAVVSTPAKPQGRGLKLCESPITLFAREHGLGPIITPENLKAPELLEQLAQLGADIFIVVAFRILPKAIFALPPLGTVNIHASLLPKFRGPAPIHRAIESGENETGVTVFRIDEGIDTGEVLLQRKISIGAKETTPELYARLSQLGANTLMDALEVIGTGSAEPMKQDNGLASRAPKLSKDEALIDWTLPAQRIFNKIRAFKPFPGTYTILNGKRLGVIWAEVANDSGNDKPGTVVCVTKDFIDIQCGSGILRIRQIKPEGRKEMSVHDYMLSCSIKEHSVVGV
jgi:methionyl-tRNA formyltransferase